jgi:hypothetical protein
MLEKGGGLPTLQNVKINHIMINTVKKRHLAQVLLSPQAPDFDAVMIFSDAIEGGYDYDARAVVCSMLVQVYAYPPTHPSIQRMFVPGP